MASFTATKPQSWRLTLPVQTEEGAGSVVPVSATAAQDPFFCSNDSSLIQLDALHEALSSDLLWWAEPLTPDALAALVAASVCLGVYHREGSGDNGHPGRMIGFARLITDRITFAYLTDVYVLPAYQHRGLGTWLMSCLREMLVGGPTGTTTGETSGDATTPGWQNLRSLWLIASTPAAARMYETTLKAHTVARYRAMPGKPDSGMIMLEMAGPASGFHRNRKFAAARSLEA